MIKGKNHLASFNIIERSMSNERQIDEPCEKQNFLDDIATISGLQIGSSLLPGLTERRTIRLADKLLNYSCQITVSDDIARKGQQDEIERVHFQRRTQHQHL